MEKSAMQEALKSEEGKKKTIKVKNHQNKVMEVRETQLKETSGMNKNFCR